jgi:glycosyltransferase involved in cell wall biosynthesis
VMKVIISSGFGKLHFSETARAAAMGGAEVEFVTGWLPSRLFGRVLDALGRPLGEASLSTRMRARIVDHPRVTMRSNALAEFAGNTITRGLKPAFPSGNLSGVAFGIAGAATCRWLHDADIFHVRSGAGQGGAIRTARKNGLRVLTDHSIAHPEYMDDVLAEEFERLGIPFQRMSSNGLWSRVLYDCRECDRLLVNSDFVKRTFVERGFAADIIDVAYLGVRERYFSLKKNYAIGGTIHLLFTGSFNLRKGVATLLDAIRMLRSGGLDVRLRVIGNITDGKACLRDSDFEFLTHTSFIPPEQLLPAFAEADLFVFPTLIEGSSRSAMEAAAAGLPIITTLNCGIPLESENEVIYVPMAHPQALASAIDRLAGDEALRTRLGQSAARRIKHSYTWEQYGKQLLKIYSRLLELDPSSISNDGRGVQC